MIEVEKALADALVITSPRLDEARLRAGVTTRLKRRQARRAAAKVAVAIAGVTIAILARPWWAPSKGQPERVAVVAHPVQTSARKPRAVRRPVFAVQRTRAPAREARLIAQEIQRVRTAIVETPVAERAELWFRLGALHDEQRQASATDSPERAIATHAAIEAWQSLFEEVRYRQHPRRAEALFETAYLLHLEDRVAEAQPLFQRLIDEHPQSPLVPNAEVARAESFFESNDMENARAHYQAVLGYRQSPLWVYAQYKLGWVHHNLGERDEAIAAFARIVELGEANQLGHDAPSTMVVAQSKKDLAMMRGAK